MVGPKCSSHFMQRLPCNKQKFWRIRLLSCFLALTVAASQSLTNTNTWCQKAHAHKQLWGPSHNIACTLLIKCANSMHLDSILCIACAYQVWKPFSGGKVQRKTAATHLLWHLPKHKMINGASEKQVTTYSVFWKCLQHIYSKEKKKNWGTLRLRF